VGTTITFDEVRGPKGTREGMISVRLAIRRQQLPRPIADRLIAMSLTTNLASKVVSKAVADRSRANRGSSQAAGRR
jgi:hypothetical protein